MRPVSPRMYTFLYFSLSTKLENTLKSTAYEQVRILSGTTCYSSLTQTHHFCLLSKTTCQGMQIPTQGGRDDITRNHGWRIW